MPRITTPANIEAAPAAARPLLEAGNKQLGFAERARYRRQSPRRLARPEGRSGGAPAAKVVREGGHVSDTDVQAVRMAGYDDAQIVEIVQHVALNTWTNYIDEVDKAEIDFLLAQTLAA